MADSSSTTATTSSTAASTTANPPETKSWADQADEIDEAEQSSAANENDVTAETNIGSLQVDESKRVNSTLSDPDDSSIQAVRFS